MIHSRHNTFSNGFWRSPPARLLLRPGDTHLWLISLGGSDGHYVSCLSGEELVRAEGFARRQDRTRFLLARAALRTILGSYLGCTPESMCFSLGKHGKPMLAKGGGKGLQFNLSHAGEIALVAVARQARVGIDVELRKNRSNNGIEAIIRRFFTARERTILEGFEENRKRDTFYQFWTRKEAVVKALGASLPAMIGDFDVSTAGEMIGGVDTPGVSTAGVPVPEILEPERWFVADLYLTHGYTASVCVETKKPVFSFWRFSGF